MSALDRLRGAVTIASSDLGETHPGTLALRLDEAVVTASITTSHGQRLPVGRDEFIEPLQRLLDDATDALGPTDEVHARCPRPARRGRASS